MRRRSKKPGQHQVNIAPRRYAPSFRKLVHCVFRVVEGVAVQVHRVGRIRGQAPRVGAVEVAQLGVEPDAANANELCVGRVARRRVTRGEIDAVGIDTAMDEALEMNGIQPGEDLPQVVLRTCERGNMIKEV